MGAMHQKDFCAAPRQTENGRGADFVTFLPTFSQNQFAEKGSFSVFLHYQNLPGIRRKGKPLKCRFDTKVIPGGFCIYATQTIRNQVVQIFSLCISQFCLFYDVSNALRGEFFSVFRYKIQIRT